MASICVVYTGGTMGSVKNEEGVLVSASLEAFEARVHQVAENAPWLSNVEFVAVEGKPIDSADACPKAWMRVRAVLAQEWHRHQGFVVVHGTDTMSYLAAFLSFAIECQDKPVVVTGSMKSLFASRGDARGNLEASIRVAQERTVGGNRIDQVLICAGERILRGNRVAKVGADAQAFNTPRVSPIGTFRQSRNQVRIDWFRGHPKTQVQKEGVVDFPPVRHSSVGLIKLFPGITVSMLRNMLLGLEGVVVEAYGSGTGPQAIRDELVAHAARGLIVVATTDVLEGQVQIGEYETDLVKRSDSSVVSGRSMLAEAALAKLYYYLGRADRDVDINGNETLPPRSIHWIRDLMGKSLRGEASSSPIRDRRIRRSRQRRHRR